jgi:hypothetical protein
MKVVDVKTIRFAPLVQSFGRPRAKTLWSDPKSDRDLQKAIKENRLLTIVQHNVGTKTDYGLIGFFPEEKGPFLIFPKALGYAAGSKVVGLKWDLIEEPAPPDPVDWRSLQRAQTRPNRRNHMPGEETNPPPFRPKNGKVAESGIPRPAPAPVPEAPKLKRFHVTIEVTARQQIETQVEGHTKTEARKNALAMPLHLDWKEVKTGRVVKAVKAAP